MTELTIDNNKNNADVRHVDFVWGHLDVQKLRETAVNEPRLKGEVLTLPIYRGAVDRPPDAEHAYGFASYSQTALIRGRTTPILVRDPVHEVGMTFDGYDARGLCRFRLDGKHKGHEAYYGSSGSPIADDEGTIVALVQGGCALDGIIFGVPLHRYARVIDIPAT